MFKPLAAVFGAIALSSLSISSASADGLPSRGSVKDTLPPPVHSWTGIYLGAHIGAAMTDDTVSERGPPFYNGAQSFQNSGGNSPNFFGGLQLGYNYQMQGIVLGIEGDVGWMDIGRSTQIPTFQGNPARIGDSVAGLDGGWYGAITGRLGVTLTPKLLIYAKAGWAFVDSSVSYTDPNPAGLTLVSGTSKSDTFDGAVYGGGLEWAFDRNWSIKAEYLHFDLGTTNIVARASNGLDYTFHRDLGVDTVKAGINYKF